MNLDEAAKRLKEIGEKDYTARLADVLGGYEERKREEENAGEMAPAAIERMLLACGDDEPEALYTPTLASVQAHNVRFGDLHLIDEETLRKFVREEVHRALYPTAEMANPHEHRRIEMTEESGKKWRGVLYGVEDEQPINQSNQL